MEDSLPRTSSIGSQHQPLPLHTPAALEMLPTQGESMTGEKQQQDLYQHTLWPQKSGESRRIKLAHFGEIVANAGRVWDPTTHLFGRTQESVKMKKQKASRGLKPSRASLEEKSMGEIGSCASEVSKEMATELKRQLQEALKQISEQKYYLR